MKRIAVRLSSLLALMLLFAIGLPGETFAIYQRAPQYYAPSYFGFVEEQDDLNVTLNGAEARLQDFNHPEGSFTHELVLQGEATSFNYYFYADYVQGQGLVTVPEFEFVNKTGPLDVAVEVVGAPGVSISNYDYLTAETWKWIRHKYSINLVNLNSISELTYYRYALNGYDSYVYAKGEGYVFTRTSVECNYLLDDNVCFFHGGIEARASETYIEFYATTDMTAEMKTYNGATVTLLESHSATVDDLISYYASGENIEPTLMKPILVSLLNNRFLNLNQDFFTPGAANSVFLCRAHFEGLNLSEPTAFVAKRTGKARSTYTLVAHFAAGTNYPAYRFTLAPYKGGVASLKVEFDSFSPYSDVKVYHPSTEEEKFLQSQYAAEVVDTPNPMLIFDSADQRDERQPFVPDFTFAGGILMSISTFFVPITYPLFLVIGISEGNSVAIIGCTAAFLLSMGILTAIFLPKIIRRAKRNKEKK